jgi:hypothetical protein
MKISDQEKRNAWLSIYSTSLAGVVGEEDLEDEEVDDLSNTAADLADAGLALYEQTFSGSGRGRGREEETEDPDEEERPRRSRSRRTG